MKIELSINQLCFIRQMLESEYHENSYIQEMKYSVIDEIEDYLTPEQIEDYNVKYWRL